MRPLYAAMATAVALLALQFLSSAYATWKPEYALQPQWVRDWYGNAEMTPRASARIFPNYHDGNQKCCARSEVVKTQFRVNKTTAGDEWWWLDGATWKRIPDDVIHWNERAPDGKPTLFIYQGQETCFFPADGGI